MSGEDDEMDMAEVMRSRRAALGLSQAELARLAGTNVRQIGRYEKGETQPLLPAALKIADALDISVSELAGREPHHLDLSGRWFAAWQTYKDGVQRIDVHGLLIRQQGDFLQLTAERAAIPLEGGSYAWRGELRLFDGDTLMGWYASTEAAVRSKGTMYLKLHHHGLHALGRWVGESYDGDIVTGFGGIARDETQAGDAVRALVDQGGPEWTRSVT